MTLKNLNNIYKCTVCGKDVKEGYVGDQKDKHLWGQVFCSWKCIEPVRPLHIPRED